MLKRAMNFGRLVAFSLMLTAALANSVAQATDSAHNLAQAADDATYVASAIQALADGANQA